jgi:LysR family transcriptional regulator of beta-lactamase
MAQAAGDAKEQGQFRHPAGGPGRFTGDTSREKRREPAGAFKRSPSSWFRPLALVLVDAAMSRPMPPLNAIRAFEVACRHLNLSRAAEELSVTQGAISKQVIALEDFIGAQLFVREPGGLRLTNEGASLKEAIQPAFAMLSEAFGRYSRRSPRSNVVRLSTTVAFASEVLAPRLAAFRASHPGIELEFMTSERLVDLSREEFDFVVRYGVGDWEGVVSVKLAEGLLAPVCAPDVWARASEDLKTLLATAPRIRSAAFDEWRLWAEREGDVCEMAPTPIVIENFLVAQRAAEMGQGVALLPEVMVRNAVARGDLVIVSPVRLENAYTFYLAHTIGAVKRPIAQEVIAWLKAELA